MKIKYLFAVLSIVLFLMNCSNPTTEQEQNTEDQESTEQEINSEEELEEETPEEVLSETENFNEEENAEDDKRYAHIVLPTVKELRAKIKEWEKKYCKTCDCEKAWKGIDGHGSMMELSSCSALDNLNAELELYKTYEQIRKEYIKQPIFLKNLEKSQKLWTLMHQADLDMIMTVEEDDHPGSVYNTCWSAHSQELFEERTKKLHLWIEGVPQGDVCDRTVKRADYSYSQIERWEEEGKDVEAEKAKYTKFHYYK